MPRQRSYSTASSTSTFSINTLSSYPSDSLAAPSTPHAAHRHTNNNNANGNEQEMALGSMYDYLVKFILIGPSGCGKYCFLVYWTCELISRSCLLHRFIRDEWKGLSSHTIGVEFANKIVKLGSASRRKRMKLQVLL
jgi:hypothetical protein